MNDYGLIDRHEDVAKAAGVSLGTVSNVVNLSAGVSEATAAKVRAAIDELGYVRSLSARQLRAGRSRVVGLLLQDSGDPYIAA
ncbi:LacI family DNA-binding transcriptional regulator [Actinospica robiniae]|uniref:LacI family DNA-binding transcriptional regulator n=1 Tax=Actinospica robiniae TaxID=304901 RepID=UPI00042A277A|nr:LacI family DNA-binding transcriptional regulator [Actinospica robiniae]